MTKDEIVPPGDTRRYTDRELLKSCLGAMEVAQRQTIPTDWRHMIAAIEAHLANERGTDAKDAARYRWLCDGRGYFMEEECLCGHSNEKEAADKMIDAAMLRHPNRPAEPT